MVTSQIKSRQRVAKHGEVLTGEREVRAMLDLVKQETERIESRFLEPACGTGNFLVEILHRKLAVVEARYRSSRLEWERNAVLAVSAIYGIELQADNVEACRDRLFGAFDAVYTKRYRSRAIDQCRASVQYLLERNILCGNALTLETEGDKPGPIVFSEWSPVNGSMLKRRDFAFEALIPEIPKQADQQFRRVQRSLFQEEQGSLFDQDEQPLRSDIGADVFIPRPIRDYPLAHFLDISHAYD